MVTGGRTRSAHDDLAPSIAELAGQLNLPLGVARVLVSDMTADGILRRHRDSDPLDCAFIEELIKGIWSL
ncbi:MAG: DUF742 domain-containing protein [Actinomycetia bacterium]|nr:DUF742 domain-containing protein [Actinomycetes bacterium]MCP4225371.1 DUF742 domain-containing protein [Actinomycetes bacterium]MCP5034526.1 DUF742 domain-containing protein [Actinomycetes bacterium]